jgi:hypothetical protein
MLIDVAVRGDGPARTMGDGDLPDCDAREEAADAGDAGAADATDASSSSSTPVPLDTIPFHADTDRI